MCEHAATLQVWTRRKCYILLPQPTHRGMRFLLAAVSSIRLCTHFAVQDALSSAQSEVDRARDESDVARREADAAREHAMALHEAAEAQRDHVTRCAANRCPVTHSRVRATAALLGLLWIEHDRTDARLRWLRAMECVSLASPVHACTSWALVMQAGDGAGQGRRLGSGGGRGAAGSALHPSQLRRTAGRCLTTPMRLFTTTLRFSSTPALRPQSGIAYSSITTSTHRYVAMPLDLADERYNYYS